MKQHLVVSSQTRASAPRDRTQRRYSLGPETRLSPRPANPKARADNRTGGDSRHSARAREMSQGLPMRWRRSRPISPSRCPSHSGSSLAIVSDTISPCHECEAPQMVSCLQGYFSASPPEKASFRKVPPRRKPSPSIPWPIPLLTCHSTGRPACPRISRAMCIASTGITSS